VLGEFDLIIGSDVLYEPGQPQQLAGFIERHAAWRAEVLIVDPNRGNRLAFNRCMARLGFSLKETPIDAPLHDGSPYRGRLLHYRRAARSPVQAVRQAVQPGRVNRKTAPLPGSDSARTRPPWRRTTRATVARPMPLPANSSGASSARPGEEADEGIVYVRVAAAGEPRDTDGDHHLLSEPAAAHQADVLREDLAEIVLARRGDELRRADDECLRLYAELASRMPGVAPANARARSWPQPPSTSWPTDWRSFVRMPRR
jgi:hypothetical protein